MNLSTEELEAVAKLDILKAIKVCLRMSYKVPLLH